MIYGQYPLSFYLRGISAGLFVAISGIFGASAFPYALSMLVISWVIAGIYGKVREEEDEKQKIAEMKELYRKRDEWEKQTRGR